MCGRRCGIKDTAGKQSAWINPLIILLTLAAALIHFLLNFLRGEFDLMFTLNGLGYLGLLAALYLDMPYVREHRRLVRIALMAFTLITLIAWVILGDMDWWVGSGTAVLEIILLLLLSVKRP